MRKRGSIHVAAVLLLILVSIGAAVLLWLYTAGLEKPEPKRPCMVSVDAVREETVSVEGKDGVTYTYAYALRVWLRALTCDARLDRAYLLYPDGSLASPLEPRGDRVKLRWGSVESVEFYAEGVVEPGDYLLRVPAVRGDDAVVRVSLPWRLASTLAEWNVTFDEINGSVVKKKGYHVEFIVSVNQTEYDTTYKLTVRVCAEPGYRIEFVRVEVLNASMEPPVWVGPYYVFVERLVPFTYPDCSISDFYPIRGSEQPLTILVNVGARPE